MTDGTIALAGNPNTGKSTVFNALTGAHQHVGNWPGKTVARKSGTWKYDGRTFSIVDLPGTYSLSAYSLEEIIARNYLVDERPDVVVVVVDAANIERNLYLATQILEMRGAVIIALNMADAAAKRGVKIDTSELSRRLRAPVVETTASKGRGMDELKAVIVAAVEGARARTDDTAPNGQGSDAGTHPLTAARSAMPATGEQATRTPPLGTAHAKRLAPDLDDYATDPRQTAVVVDYGDKVEAEIATLSALIQDHAELAATHNPRWLAIKLLESDPEVTAKVVGIPNTEAITTQTAAAIARLEDGLGDDVDTVIANARYQWIHTLVGETVERPPIDEVTLSDRIDAVVTHRLLGIPIFLAAMWAVFKLTTDVSAPYLDWIAGVIEGPFTSWTIQLISLLGLSGTWIEGLIVDGIVAGVGGVLVFVPVLLSLYLALAILEDSGYMARAAFVMDRLMRGFGLHGKSFLPMLVGFGCTVPAIYATRTLRDERDRILTGLLVPFMSCGARLPVYVLFATVFFPKYGGTVVFSMYLVGVLTAVVLGVILKRSLFRTGTPSPFVMELPPYRVPTPRGVALHMWSRTSSFVHKAWTIILVVSIILWFLMAIPVGGEGTLGHTPVEDSLFARASAVVAPLFSPLGFDSWKAAGALLTGLVAKEVVVSTMAQVYSADMPERHLEEPPPTLLEGLGFAASSFVDATIETIKAIPAVFGIRLSDGEPEEPPSALMQSIRADFNRSSGGYPALAALAFMVFVLLYTPCMVAIAAARHEYGAKWMWTSALGQFAIAWMIAFAVFQGGRLLVG